MCKHRWLTVALVFSAVLAITMGRAVPVSAALVAYWAMEETSWDGVSYDVVDSSGTGNNGKAYGDANTVAG